MIDSSDRILPLDALRGLAILGVMLMNVSAIALPYTLAIAPAGPGSGMADALIWLVQFTLVDGKARALLAMLFGASSLLVMDRAEMDGRDGARVQRRRMLWLLAIGLVHHVLLWNGDILMLLAFAGILSLRLAGAEPLDLVKWALLAFAGQWLVDAALLLPGFVAGSFADYVLLLDRALVRDLDLYRGDYPAILAHRAAEAPMAIGRLCAFALPELLGFMLLGMAMAKGGFFSGQWTGDQYRATAIRAGLIGFPPAFLAGICAIMASDPRVVEAIQFLAALPFRIPAAVALAALAMLAAQNASPFVERLAAAGRLALTSYLMTSLVVTLLAYGYGADLYGRLNRAALLGIGLALALTVLLVAPIWLRRIGQGPAERLWRRLYQSPA